MTPYGDVGWRVLQLQAESRVVCSLGV